MNPEDSVTKYELELVQKYESEMIQMLRDYISTRHTDKVERAAGYIAGLCTVVTAVAIGAMGEEDGTLYLSKGINRAIEGVKRVQQNERNKQDENKS